MKEIFEAFERIKYGVDNNSWDGNEYDDLDTIEKELKRLEKLKTKYEELKDDYNVISLENEFLEKALKIIIKKANIRLFVMEGSTEKDTRYYFRTTNNSYEISEEKYYVLKEVLLWE